METLNPIEKLQVMAMTDKNIFNIRNKLYCLLYQLNINNRLVFKDKKYQVIESPSNELNIIYEDEFCRLLKNKMYFNLKTFITEMHVKPTLIRKQIVRRHIQKGRFNLFNKEKYEKTELFYKIHNKIMEESYNKDMVKVICNNPKEDINIKLLVDKIMSEFKRME